MENILQKIDFVQQNSENQKKQLSLHKIFDYYSHLDKIDFEINSLNIDENRKLIGSMFLKEKYKAIILNLLDMIVRINPEEQINYKNLFFKTVKQIVEDYEKCFQKKLNENFGIHYGKKIYEIVYKGSKDKNDIFTQGFETMHDEHIGFLKVFINTQTDSMLNNTFKIITFFDMCLVAYKLAFYHIENRLEKINGILTETIEKAQKELVL